MSLKLEKAVFKVASDAFRACSYLLFVLSSCSLLHSLCPATVVFKLSPHMHHAASFHRVFGHDLLIDWNILPLLLSPLFLFLVYLIHSLTNAY